VVQVADAGNDSDRTKFEKKLAKEWYDWSGLFSCIYWTYYSWL